MAYNQSRVRGPSDVANVATLATLTSAEATSRPPSQASDLRFCVELRGIEPLTSSMPCTRQTVQHVQQRPVEATRVRSYPTAEQGENGAGNTSTVHCVRTRPAPSLAVPRRRGDREWLRCWLRRRDPSAVSRVPAWECQAFGVNDIGVTSSRWGTCGLRDDREGVQRGLPVELAEAFLGGLASQSLPDASLKVLPIRCSTQGLHRRRISSTDVMLGSQQGREGTRPRAGGPWMRHAAASSVNP